MGLEDDTGIAENGRRSESIPLQPTAAAEDKLDSHHDKRFSGKLHVHTISSVHEAKPPGLSH